MNSNFLDIWESRITANLNADSWDSSYSYNVAEYFTLPLTYAYEAGNLNFQTEFQQHFQTFVETGFTEEANWLSQSRFGHFATKFLVLETQNNGTSELTDSLLDQLTRLTVDEWSANTVSDLPGIEFTGREESILFKLESESSPILDQDLGLFSMAADLITYYGQLNLEIPQDLLDIYELAVRVYEDLGHFDDSGNWNFGTGQWSDHLDFRLANWDGQGEIEHSDVDSIGWDISHASRFPSWIESLSNAEVQLNPDTSFFQDIKTGLANQINSNVLYESTEQSGLWLTSNFLDGTDGVYRYGYQSFFENEGFLPGQLSGTFLLGSWSRLNDAAISEAYGDLLSLSNFSPFALEFFNEPIRSASLDSAFDWSDIVESGDIRLWLAMASGNTDLDDVSDYVTVDEDYLTIATGGSIDGSMLFSGANLTNIQSINIVDMRTDEGSGYFTLNGQVLEAGIVHPIPVSDLPNLLFRAGSGAGGDRIYWQTDEPTESLWTSIDVSRENKVGSLVDSRISGDLGATVSIGSFIAFEDPDNDTANYYELWFDGSSENGFKIDGTLIEAETAVLITADQLADVTAYIDEGIDYYIRGTDGGAWSEWELLSFQSINVAPELSIDDQTATAGQWLRASDIFDFVDEDGDELISIQLYDDEGSNSWWADGGIVDANSGYATSNFDDIWLKADDIAGEQTLWARVSDGSDWSNWAAFTFNTEANNSAVIEVEDLAVINNNWVRLSSVATVSDEDGDAISHYQIWDDEGGNNWWADGGFVDASNGYITTDLDEIWLLADSSTSQQFLWVRAYDGKEWGKWDRFELTTIANERPEASMENLVLDAGESVNLVDELNYFDFEDDAIEAVRVWDDEGADNWFLDGEAIDASAGYTVFDFESLSIRDFGESAPQTLWIQVYDGNQWSAWDDFILT
ncbi:MAG: hypothetical protein AAF423_04500 [Pseudomonadota bacterium]